MRHPRMTVVQLEQRDWRCTGTHWGLSSLLFSLRLYFFKNSFRFTTKLRGRYQDFPYNPCPHTSVASPLPTSLSRMVPLFPKMNVHPHIISSQSPQFTLGFTLGVTHSMGVDKSTTTSIHHYSVIQSIFPAIKILCAPPHTSLSPFFGKPWSFYCLHSFAFSRMQYTWDHTACSLLRLASFPDSYALKFPPCLFMVWWLISF